MFINYVVIYSFLVVVNNNPETNTLHGLAAGSLIAMFGVGDEEEAEEEIVLEIVLVDLMD